MGVFHLWDRSVLIALCLAVAISFSLGSVRTLAASGNVSLDGDSVLAKMAGQFNVAQDLTGTVTFSVHEGEIDLRLLTGDLKVKGREHLRLDYMEPDAVAPAHYP